MPTTQPDPAVWPGLDLQALPQHVAFIMDGNRRWAKRRLLGSLQGHRAGVETVRELVRMCRDLGIPYLTLYAFSTENWRRSTEEVSFLMSLFEEVIAKELMALGGNGVRLRFLGHLAGLSPALQRRIAEAEAATAANSALTLSIAINYGGRQEIVAAAQALARRVQEGALEPSAIDEAAFAGALYTRGLPDPDLLVRTSGESRVSNYLLWQIAYSEIHFTDVLWPDFRHAEFLAALLSYQGRERRFGGSEPLRLVPGSPASAQA